MLRTCPVCMRYALDALRGVCYKLERVRGHEVVLVQQDFFSAKHDSPSPP